MRLFWQRARCAAPAERLEPESCHHVARLEPATINGLMYSSSMVVLYAARHRLPVPALARWLLALGIVATLAANVAHGWPRGPVGAVVAAWPAASLVGS